METQQATDTEAAQHQADARRVPINDCQFFISLTAPIVTLLIGGFTLHTLLIIRALP